MSHLPLAVTVRELVPASAATVYALISDVTSIPLYSPEVTSAAWVDGATGPVVGATFRGTNAVGRVRWSTRPVVTVADPGRRFAFVVPSGARSTWTYLLEPSADGTWVTESVRTERAVPAVVRLLLRSVGVTDRAEHLRTSMRTTLRRLSAAAVAAEHPAAPIPAA